MEIDFMGLYSKNPAPSYDPDASVDSGIGSGELNVSLSLCTSSPMDGKTVFQDFLRIDDVDDVAEILDDSWKTGSSLEDFGSDFRNLEARTRTLEEGWKKKIRKPPAENMTSIQNSAGKYDWENAQLGERSRPSFTGKPIISHSGFRYNRNDRSSISRNTFERTLSLPASSTVFCPTAAPNLFPAQKADRKMYATGVASLDDIRKSEHGYTPTVAMARKATLARFLEKRSHRLNQRIKSHLMGRSLNWCEACNTTFTKRNKKIKSSMHAV